MSVAGLDTYSGQTMRNPIPESAREKRNSEPGASFGTVLSEKKTEQSPLDAGKWLDVSDTLKMAGENRGTAAGNSARSDDWRKMSDDEWDKLMKGIDRYIEVHRERLKEKNDQSL